MIINREFWPDDQVNGGALLCLAERAVKDGVKTTVVAQSHGDTARAMAASGRGEGVSLRCCRAWSGSSASLPRRILDAAFFMFWCLVQLLACRPSMVYVATSPPVLVPFLVCLYARLFRARYVYHLQDIHPEATNIVAPMPGALFRLLRCLDGITLRHAHRVITLSEEMEQTLLERSATGARIVIIDNPAVFESCVADDVMSDEGVEGDVIFCGNAGRFQRIPLLISSIQAYYRQGGRLRFTFAGDGVYREALRRLADELETVTYLGLLPAAEATRQVSQHRWALLPIDDEVTRYAFPSKTSCYLIAGCQVLAICSADTSVARWVREQGCGLVAMPSQDAVVSAFVAMEQTEQPGGRSAAFSLKEAYSVETHAERLYAQLSLPLARHPAPLGQRAS
jgi:glycosyltransferase involved in cell wall biosynthesis